MTFSSAVAENVGKEVSVDKKVCVGRRNRIKSENIEKKSAYKYVSGKFTFLVQFQPDTAVLIGQFPVFAYQLMVHVTSGIVHALQKNKCKDLKLLSKLYIEDPARMLGTYPESQ
jgi:hypothetical protein